MNSSRTKTVIFVAPDFVPSSRPPALRAKFAVKYFNDFGWVPTVLTVDPSGYDWPIDTLLKRTLPEDLKMSYAKALPVSWTRFLGIRDIAIRGLWGLRKKIYQLCRTNPIDLVCFSVPPYLTVSLAPMILKRFGIPYVLDYQDPWSTGYFDKSPSFVSRVKGCVADTLCRSIEPKVIQNVSGISAVSQGTLDLIYQKYPASAKLPSQVIPLGVDPDDFKSMRESAEPQRFFNRKDGLKHICYVGVYIPEMEKSLRAILGAIKKGMVHHPDLFCKMRWHFIGTSYDHYQPKPQIISLAKQMGVDSFVIEEPGRVSYLEALRIMRDSDALMALGSTAPHYTASKIYPYLLSEKPILAVFHRESSVVQVLNQAGIGTVITFDEKSPAEELIDPVIRFIQSCSGQTCESKETRTDIMAAYSSKQIAYLFTSWFDRVLESGKAS